MLTRKDGTTSEKLSVTACMSRNRSRSLARYCTLHSTSAECCSRTMGLTSGSRPLSGMYVIFRKLALPLRINGATSGPVQIRPASWRPFGLVHALAF